MITRRRVGSVLLALMIIATVLAAWVWTSFVPPDPLPVPVQGLILDDVTIVNPGEDRIAGQRIRVDGGVIAQITDASPENPAPPETTSLSGLYALPGIIDMHVHYPPAAVRLTRYFSLLYLAHGVTSVRDAADTDGTASAKARAGSEEAAFPSPRVFASGPFVDEPPKRWANTRLVHNADEARQAVRDIKADGFKVIKAYDHLSLDVLEAIKDEAKAQSMGVMGHVPFALSYEEARLPDAQHFYGVPGPQHLESDSIAHRIHAWQHVDDARMDVIVNATLEHGLANTPTLVSSAQLLLMNDYDRARGTYEAQLVPRFYRDVVWNPIIGLSFYRELTADDFAALEEKLEKMKTLVSRLHAAGTPIHLGTDTQQPFIVPGASLHQELHLVVEAGLTPEEAWRSASRDSGTWLGVTDLGVLKEGAPADLLIYREDPTQNLAALDTLEAVIADGRLYLKRDIDAALQQYQAHYSSFIYDRITMAAAARLVKKNVVED